MPRSPSRAVRSSTVDASQRALFGSARLTRGQRFGAGVCVAALSMVAACSGDDRPKGAREAVPAPFSVRSDESAYEWTPIRLGAGGFVTGVVLHPTAPDVRFMRTDVGGAFRWDADGAQWEQMLRADAVPDADTHPGDYAVESVAVSPSDPAVVYLSAGNDFNPTGAVAGSGRVLRSGDGGRTWTAGTQKFFISGNQDYRQLGERIAVDPTNPDHVLLGTRREGLWSSIDGGATWVQAADVPAGAIRTPADDQPGVMFTVFDPATSGRAYAGVAGVGVFRSDDSGSTWQSIRTVEPGVYVPSDGKVAAGRLVVAFNDGGTGVRGELEVYDPATGAWEWITPDADAKRWAIAADITTPGNLLAVPADTGEGRLHRSANWGADWSTSEVKDETTEVPWISDQSQGSFFFTGQVAFDPLVPGRIWWADGVGLFRSDDLTADPVKMKLDSRGVELLVSAELIAPEGQGPTAAVADFQGFDLPDLAAFPEEMLVNDDFAGGTDLDFSGQQPSSMVWVGAEYHVYFTGDWDPRGATSDDGGVTWKPLPGLTKEMFGGEVAISATDPENIVWLPTYFGDINGFRTEPKGVYVTTDRGDHWTNLPDVGGTNDFHRFLWWLGRQALVADKVEGGVFYMLSSDGRFFISVDKGLTWTERPEAPPCTEANDCHVIGQLRADPLRSGHLWASVGKGGLYQSTDQGTSWTQHLLFTSVQAVALGAPLSDGGPAAVYALAATADRPTAAIWRSGDDGDNWELLGDAPADLYGSVNVLAADMSEPGRVYVGFAGNGFVYGDDPTL